MGFAKPLLILLALAGAAFADDKAEAKKHYELGKRHFNVNEFTEAIAEFKTAYKLYPEASDLYNIAQAYRLLGDCVNAATFYGNYQRDEKNKKLRDSVDKVKAEMEACAAAPKPEPVVTDTRPEPGPTVPPPQAYRPPPVGPPTGENAMRAPPGPEDPNKARRVAGITMMVVGALFLTSSIYWAVEADSRGKQADACDLDEFCSVDRFDELVHDRDVAKKTAGASFGGAVVFGGVGFILYRISRKPSTAHVTVRPTRHGAAIGWAF